MASASRHGGSLRDPGRRRIVLRWRVDQWEFLGGICFNLLLLVARMLSFFSEDTAARRSILSLTSRTTMTGSPRPLSPPRCFQSHGAAFDSSS